MAVGRVALRLRPQVHLLAHRLQPEDDGYAGRRGSLAIAEAARLHSDAAAKLSLSLRAAQAFRRCPGTAGEYAGCGAKLVRLSHRRPRWCAIQPRCTDPRVGL